DLSMPDYPGFSVLLALRSTGLDVPTIVITGHEDPAIAARAQSFGARLVLRKPLDATSLRAAAEHTLESTVASGERAHASTVGQFEPVLPSLASMPSVDPTLDVQTTAGRSKRRPIGGHPFAIGERVLDVYELQRVLGEGGTAVVFEARDRILGRHVAVKAPLADELHDTLLHEARVLGALDEPCVPRVIHAAHWRGVPVVVMERVDGLALDTMLMRATERGERIAIDDAIVLLHLIARAVAVVHRAGLAHRDLKPGNIVLAPCQRVVLLDFGIAVAECEAAATDARGTPAYMAPESQRAVGPGDRHLSDLYSLGVVAYEILAGHRPYHSNDFATEESAGREVAIAKLREVRSEVPEHLSRLVHELLAHDPARRPQSAEAVAVELEAMCARDSTRPPSVLIVDDDPDFVEVARRVIRGATPDAIVTSAFDARQAIDALERAPVDVMFVDLNMPTMNGIELLMYLRDAHLADQTSIALVTARASDGDLAVSRRLGVSTVVDKEHATDGDLALAHTRLVERRRSSWLGACERLRS
ncbi:MAG: response regulator, partial [Polyangiales bacterium]